MKVAIEHKTSQVLSMTPRLQQAIRLLQMPQDELFEFVQEQVTENPFLSLDDTQRTHLPSYEDFPHIKEKESLESYLLRQLHASTKDPLKISVGTYLIYNLDERGFIQEPHEALAKQFQISETTLEKIILFLQTLEPTGVFARHLEESLCLQLQEQKKLTPQLEKLLQHLNMFSSLKDLARKTGLSFTEIQEAFSVCKSLKMNPVDQFQNREGQFVRPDIYVYKNNEGTWDAALSDTSIPAVSFNEDYYKEVKERLQNAKDKSYLKGRYGHSDWLLKALKQRKITLLRVGKEIVRLQQYFFDEGAGALSPLSMKNIAQALGIHESTVSRIIHEKYIETPLGVFPLRFFFNATITQKGNLNAASRSIQERIRTLIREENKKTPLSDDHIVLLLEKEGVRLARRTVTKYRKALNIDTSHNRKKVYTIERGEL